METPSHTPIKTHKHQKLRNRTSTLNKVTVWPLNGNSRVQNSSTLKVIKTREVEPTSQHYLSHFHLFFLSLFITLHRYLLGLNIFNDKLLIHTKVTYYYSQLEYFKTPSFSFKKLHTALHSLSNTVHSLLYTLHSILNTVHSLSITVHSSWKKKCVSKHIRTQSDGLLFCFVLVFASPSAAAFREPPRRTVPHSGETLTLPPYDTVNLNCPIVGTPTPIFEWSKDGESISDGWDRIHVSKNNLKIRNIEYVDTGRYICTAVNGFGKQNYSFTVRIDDPLAPSSEYEDYKPPHLQHSSPPLAGPPLTRQVGSSVRFECQFDGVPEPEVQWLKDGIAVPHNWHVSRSPSRHSLQVSPLLPHHTGLYTCVAINEYGSDTVNWTLHVVGPSVPLKPLTTHHKLSPRNTSVPTGVNVAVMSCRGKTTGEVRGVKWLRERPPDLTGTLSPDQVLTLEGKQYHVIPPTNVITTMEGIFITELSIPNPKPEDAGEYLCMATTPEGLAFGNAALTVLPRSPGNILLVVMGGLAALALVVIVFAIVATCRRQKNRNGSSTNRRNITNGGNGFTKGSETHSSQASSSLLPSSDAKMHHIVMTKPMGGCNQYGTPHHPQGFASGHQGMGPGNGQQHFQRYHPSMQGKVGDSTASHLSSDIRNQSDNSRTLDLRTSGPVYVQSNTQLSPNQLPPPTLMSPHSECCHGPISPQDYHQYTPPATSSTSPHSTPQPPPTSYEYHQLDVI